MSWNYRVVRSIEPDGSKHYEIREAFYNSPNDTAPHSITEDGVRAGGSTLLELRKDLALMLAAFDQTPLRDETFTPHVEPLSFSAGEGEP